MPNINQVLSKFGLSDKEISVYKAALKLEETSPYQLSKLTKIPRTTIYDVLMSLSLKGLIEMTQSDGFTKQQTKVKAKNPSVLRTILKNRRQDMLKTEIDILDILPSLKSDYHQNEANADFQFYPGIKGAKKVFSEEISTCTNQPIYALTKLIAADVFGKEELNKSIEKETQALQAKNIQIKEIVPLNDWTKHVISYQASKNSSYLKTRQLRYIDNPGFDQFIRLAVNGNRARMVCAHQEEVWGLVINSPAAAMSFKSILELLWHQSTPITQEFLESWGENEYIEAEKKK